MADDNKDYRTIDVEGMGTLRFPKDMPIADIEWAIKNHPNYPKDADKSFGRKSFENTAGFINEMGKGIPVAGHYIPRGEYAESLKENHPYVATGARVLGGTAATIPLMAATGGMVGPGLGAQMFTQGATGAGLGVADKLAEKGTSATNSDLAMSGIFGGIGGVSGPLIGRLITPSTPRNITPEDIRGVSQKALQQLKVEGVEDLSKIHGMDLQRAIKSQLEQIPKANPPKPWMFDTIANAGTGSALGAAAGHYLFDSPMVGAVVGGAAGHSADMVKEALMRSPWATNTLMHSNVNKSILDALSTSIPSSIMPH